MTVRCTYCDQRGRIPAGRSPDEFVCGNCGRATLVAAPNQASPELAVSGAMGGALLGGAVGGPPGAVVGAVVGFLLGKNAG